MKQYCQWGNQGLKKSNNLDSNIGSARSKDKIFDLGIRELILGIKRGKSIVRWRKWHQECHGGGNKQDVLSVWENLMVETWHTNCSKGKWKSEREGHNKGKID